MPSLNVFSPKQSFATPVFVALLALALSLPVVHASEPVAPARLATMLQETPTDQRPLVLDVRTPDEFDAGHVPGAVLIPHDQLEGRLQELDPARSIVVYCRTGRRSTIAEDLLRARGYDVIQLEGSWQAWQAAGLPIDRTTSP